MRVRASHFLSAFPFRGRIPIPMKCDWARGLDTRDSNEDSISYNQSNSIPFTTHHISTALS
jgi:hypothetical protein